MPNGQPTEAWKLGDACNFVASIGLNEDAHNMSANCLM